MISKCHLSNLLITLPLSHHPYVYMTNIIVTFIVSPRPLPGRANLMGTNEIIDSTPCGAINSMVMSGIDVFLS